MANSWVGELMRALLTAGVIKIERPASAPAAMARTINGSTAFRESNKLNGRWNLCFGDLLCKNDRRPAKGSEC